MENLSILIAEDDDWYAEFVKYTITLTGEHNFQIVRTVKQLLNKLLIQPDIITLDFNFPDGTGEDMLRQIKSKYPESYVVVISAQEDVQVAVNLLNNGAFDYVVKNDEARNRIVQIIRSIAEKKSLKKQIVDLENEVRVKYDYRETLISNSKTFKSLGFDS